MNNRLMQYLGLLAGLIMYGNGHAVGQPGPLMTVTGTGGQGPFAVNVWLNGAGPLSGQSFEVTGYTLTVTPSHSQHTYPSMGLEVTTPGLAVTSGCDSYVGNRCIFSASAGSPRSLTVAPTTGTHYLFITSTIHNGELGGVSGADVLCNTVAQGSGNPIISGLPFKAVLVASHRYPCDNTGACGGVHSEDWPLLPNTQYLNPDNTPGTNFTTNASYVFPQPAGTVTSFQDENGTTTNNYFWSGVQSVEVAADDPANIIGWAYSNVNPASAQNYTQYLATCLDWTSSVSTGIIGSTGFGGFQASIVNTVVGGIWGNYWFQLDNRGGYTSTAWVLPEQLHCSNTVHLVCAS